MKLDPLAGRFAKYFNGLLFKILKTLPDLIDGNFLIPEFLIKAMTNEFFYPQHNQLLIALINYRQ